LNLAAGSRRQRVAFASGLAAIVLIGTLIRLPLLATSSASYRLTEAFNIEEVENLRLSTGMLHKHTLNPHAFMYPGLFYYLSLVPEMMVRRGGPVPWSAALVGVRLLSLIFSIGTLLVAAALARRLAGNAAGLFAAALLAFDRTQIEIATLAKPNAAQSFFLLAAFGMLALLAARPRAATAALAAGLLGLAAASKWLGALGLGGLIVAPLLAHPASSAIGWRRLSDSLRTGISAAVPAWQLLLPPLVFVAVFAACNPFALLSPREFGAGIGELLTSQSLHQRPLPVWMPLMFLVRSLGVTGALAAGLSVIWGLGRMTRWDGSAHDRGVALVLGWVVVYGLLLMFVFVRLPGYLDLWTPFLAVLAGCAWLGERGWLRSNGARIAALTVAVAAGLITNGAFAAAKARLAREFDTRNAAGAWLAASSADSESVLADLGAYIPDSFRRVAWINWGGPPRVIYDETRTWGSDPVWPEWYGGHRRLWFENAKWHRASELLANRPRWVIVNEEWRAIRAHPSYASETADRQYDRGLEDGSAGYALRARFAPSAAPGDDWSVLGHEKRTSESGPWYGGPTLSIYQRTRD